MKLSNDNHKHVQFSLYEHKFHSLKQRFKKVSSFSPLGSPFSSVVSWLGTWQLGAFQL